MSGVCVVALLLSFVLFLMYGLWSVIVDTYRSYESLE